jgi:putative transcriptional regulator
MVIKNRIRRLRFDNNEMTQQDLAVKAGCTRQTIHAIEVGKYLPSLDVAFKVAKVFNVPVDEVFYVESPELDET